MEIYVDLKDFILNDAAIIGRPFLQSFLSCQLLASCRCRPPCCPGAKCVALAQRWGAVALLLSLRAKPVLPTACRCF
jgi:hypothetical protein